MTPLTGTGICSPRKFPFPHSSVDVMMNIRNFWFVLEIQQSNPSLDEIQIFCRLVFSFVSFDGFFFRPQALGFDP
jgi:hypothetical protein